MKYFSIILFLAVSLVSFMPSILLIKSVVKTQLSSNDECCKKGNCCTDTNESENNNPCTSGMCNSSQCIFACFLCPINNTPLQINLFESRVDLKPIAVQYNLSEFSAECWQPPKFLIS